MTGAEAETVRRDPCQPSSSRERRLVRLMREAVAELRLDLRGARVVTEAATGAYAVTPVLAALAGASVVAVGRASVHGSYSDLRRETVSLAEAAGVARRVRVTDRKRREDLARADIVTNSGHLRPLDEPTIRCLKAGAVIPLMYEAWELAARPTDVDLRAAERYGVAVAGTNERHAAVDVFSYLGLMGVRILLDAGVAVHRSRVLLLCDNDFGPYVQRGLTAAGAVVCLVQTLPSARLPAEPDAVLTALTPRSRPVIGPEQAEWLARVWPSSVVVQFWGDLDRAALGGAGVDFWPPTGPPPGHMAVLPSHLGPEPVVRLQAGGLKVGEVLWRGDTAAGKDREFVDAF